ncbi:hypothetical protein BC835DRAFT_718152 [Cytidiella melzeri]|nr:hypothetical protein BC835DRAFT_718152 [Cytidiella melzeri]
MGNLYTSRIFRHFLPQRLIRKPRSATKDNNADGGKLRREKPPTETSAAPSTQHKIQLDLPVELLLHVFMHLPAFDLLRCRSVCKHFKTIIDESPETQYMTELHAAGYQNNELCTDMGTAARLDALKKEVRFWRNPTGSWNRTSFPWSVTYEDLCCTSWHDNFWARSKKLAGVVEGKWNAVQCVLLQRAVSGPPVAESWQLTFPFSFISITAHPPESTLVLLDVEVSHTPRHEHYVISP